jgi:polysaccharide pyruvyl transferase WcaK-like protein
MTVLVINQYSSNKGDRAVCLFVLRQLAHANVDRIILSTDNPSNWRARELEAAGGQVDVIGWGIRTPFASWLPAPISYSIWKRCFFHVISLAAGKKDGPVRTRVCNRDFQEALEAADLVVSTGGHHITTLLNENMVSQLLFDLVLVVLADKKLILWSQTVGPLDFTDYRCKQAVAAVLRHASLIAVRDELSAGVITESVGDAHGRIVPTGESVFGLNDVIPEVLPPSRRTRLLGISIYAAQVRTEEERLHYVNAISDLASHASEAGWRVEFFPMELKGSGPDDRPLIREITDDLPPEANWTVVDEDLPTAEHLRRVSQCRAFVGHKTHSVIFSLTTGTPLLAIAYHPKTREFMKQFNVEENCIDDSGLEGARLIETFERITRQLDAVGQKQADKAAAKGAVVRSDFSAILEGVK